VTQRELDRLAHQIYAELRAGQVGQQTAFDFALLVMDTGSRGPAATELAALAVEGGNRERIAELARQVLADIGFEPDFTDEPGWLDVFQRALAILQADLLATGLNGAAGMVMHEGSDVPAVLITFRGNRGSTSGMPPAEGSNPLDALVAVADELQDAVVHDLMSAWPLCPVHRYGGHSRAHENAAVWWCNGSSGHVIAPIGRLE
jgi:hypothetical protein